MIDEPQPILNVFASASAVAFRRAGSHEGASVDRRRPLRVFCGCLFGALASASWEASYPTRFWNSGFRLLELRCVRRVQF